MPHIPGQNSEAVDLSCRGYRNILESRLVGASVIENLTGSVGAAEVEWQ